MIFVVLGMHKSGTTLVSQMLHHGGINMGDFDQAVSYDAGNQYEREQPYQLDLDILGAPDDEVLDLAAPKQLVLLAEHRSRMKKIIADCDSAHIYWGFKDPRASLLYQLWEEELPAHKIIVVYRDAAQIWGRYIWAGKRLYHTNFHRAYSFLHRWQEHNRNILSVLEATSNETLVFNYGDLMTSDGAYNRLVEFTDGKVEDLRKPGLFRNKSGMDIFLRSADWLMKKKYGYSVADTMARFEQFAFQPQNGEAS